MSAPHTVITGTTHGIGEVTATELARAGHDLSLLVRDPVRGEAQAHRLRALHPRPGACIRVIHCDLARLSVVRQAAVHCLAAGPPITHLINNAGLTRLRRSWTEDGFETVFAVNQLGPFLLTELLRPHLPAGARIINVASCAHEQAQGLDLASVVLPGSATATGSGQPWSGQPGSGQSAPGQSAPGQSASGQSAPGQSAPGQSASGQSASGQSAPGQSASGQSAPGRLAAYRPQQVYAQSKLANILWTIALRRRLQGAAITAHCLHPGVVHTHLLPWPVRLIKPLLRGGMIRAQDGARTTLYLALHPQPQTLPDVYLDEHQNPRTPSALARDVDLQERLWQACTQWISL